MKVLCRKHSSVFFLFPFPPFPFVILLPHPSSPAAKPLLFTFTHTPKHTHTGVLQKREAASASPADAGVTAAAFLETDVYMMQNLTSTLIISSMFFVTYAHIWISKLVISRKSLALPLVTYASCQIVAAAVPAAAFWVSNSILSPV